MMAANKDKVTSLRGDQSFLVQYANATEALPAHCIAYLTERSLRKTYFPVAAYRYDANRDELLIPYPTATDVPGEFGRRRVFAKGAGIKFRQDKGSGNHFYFAPIPARYELDWGAIASDPKIPLFICEGEVKAAALAQHGQSAIGIHGADNWQSKGQAIADFDDVVWRHREVTVITDADADQNRNVQMACVRLTEELQDRGATVFVWVPRDCDLDDMLARDGLTKVRAAIKRDRAPIAEIKDWGLTDQQPTDTGAGNVFVDLHGDIVRYCPERRSWFVKADHLWREDKQGAAIELGKVTAREMQRQALRMPSGDERNALFKDSIRRENIVPLKNMLEAASTSPDIVVLGSLLDANPSFIGVLNGVLSLADGKFLPQCPDDQYITKSLGVSFDAGAKPPRRFLRFLRETFGKDDALVQYLQKSIGYALSGTPNEQKFFVLIGSGSNGKSTFISTLQALFGDYSVATPAESLLVKTLASNGATPELVRLQGARMVIAAETEERALAESLIKQLTGGDTITARPLYQDYVEFKPMFSMFLVCNHLPVIKGTEHAIWRRVAVIPFNRTVKDKNQDPKLLDKLLAELPGILNWVLEGHRLWMQETLGICPTVAEATAVYRSEMDIVAQFIEEQCVVGPREKAPMGPLYMRFAQWCEDSGWRHPMTKNKFGRKLTERGFAGTTGGQRLRQRLALKPYKHEAPGP